jgi:pimeloyl-ACP methyl ester carboxylesterase
MCPEPASTTLGYVTAVFVHGVPETWIVWDALRETLAAESLALALPGFAAPLPGGFTASKDDYARWLAGELRAVGGPIDLVGHDFGGILCLRVVTGLGMPVRSWAVDLANSFHPDYVWHRTARIWQTPEAGEEALAMVRVDGSDGGARGAARLEQLGMPAVVSSEMSTAHDRTMSECILRLYRSALPNVRSDWRVEVPAGGMPSGLVLYAAADPFGDESMSGEVASELHAATARLDDLGHCWMAEDPERAATLLERFWASL